MNANPQAGRREGQLDARLKRGTVGEQRCAGDDAIPMGIGNAPIYTLGPAKIIRVDDQILQVPDLGGSVPVRWASCLFVRLAAFVPLTHFRPNFSMAVQRPK